jgi:hypothetical protein
VLAHGRRREGAPVQDERAELRSGQRRCGSIVGRRWTALLTRSVLRGGSSRRLGSVLGSTCSDRSLSLAAGRGCGCAAMQASKDFFSSLCLLLCLPTGVSTRVFFWREGKGGVHASGSRACLDAAGPATAARVDMACRHWSSVPTQICHTQICVMPATVP